MIENLKYALKDVLDIEPFVNEEFAQKMTDMTEEEYEKYLNDYMESLDEESLNYEMKYPRIGQIALIAAELNIEDKELWDLLVEFIRKVRYRTSLKESIKGLKALVYYRRNYIDSEDKDRKMDEVYSKLERNITKTLWYEEMKVFNEIVTALVENGRYESGVLFNKVEYYMLSNLSEDFRVELFVDSVYKFMLAGKGSAQLYTYLQTAVATGFGYSKLTFASLFSRKEHSLVFNIENVSRVCDILIYSYSNFKDKMLLNSEFRGVFFNSMKVLCHEREYDLPLPLLTKLLIVNEYCLELDDSEKMEMKGKVVEKSMMRLEKPIPLSEVNEFLRNTVLPQYSLENASSFLVQLEKGLQTGRISPSNIDDLVSLGNIYSSQGLVSEINCEQILSLMHRYLERNYMKNKMAENNKLRNMIKHIAEESIHQGKLETEKKTKYLRIEYRA